MSALESKRVCQCSSGSESSADAGKDGLSSLPDELLIKILDFVGIHEAPRTHGLSSRWKFLWAFCTELHFFVDGPDGVTPDFVDNVISQYKGSQIQYFGLTIHCDEDEEHQHLIYLPIDSWLQFAVDRRVAELELAFVPNYMFTCKVVPDLLFQSSSITRLSLTVCLLYPDSVCMSSLKEVKFFGVDFSRDSLERFTSGCPVLDLVILENCVHFNQLSVSIINPSVERLVVTDRLVHEFDEDELDEGLEIYAPHIRLIALGGKLRPEYSIFAPSLVVAKLDFFYFTKGNVSSLEGLLKCLNCSDLHLCAWCIQVLSLSKMQNHSIAPVKNVKYLHLRLPLLKCELLGLSRVVEIFPFLKSLEISFGFWNDGEREPASEVMHLFSFSIPDFRSIEWDEVIDESEGKSEVESEGWESINISFFNQLHHLKRITLNGFFRVGNLLGSETSQNVCKLHWNLFWREVQLIQKLLTNSPLLEKTIIEFPDCKHLDVSVEFAMRKLVCAQLCELSPASSKTAITFWGRKRTR